MFGGGAGAGRRVLLEQWSDWPTVTTGHTCYCPQFRSIWLTWGGSQLNITTLGLWHAQIISALQQQCVVSPVFKQSGDRIWNVWLGSVRLVAFVTSRHNVSVYLLQDTDAVTQLLTLDNFTHLTSNSLHLYIYPSPTTLYIIFCYAALIYNIWYLKEWPLWDNYPD